MVRYEVNRLKIKHQDRKLNSFHEAYGLLLEEVDEAWDEIKKKPSKRDLPNLLREFVQIASLCERAATELGLVSQADLEDRIEQGGYINTHTETLTTVGL